MARSENFALNFFTYVAQERENSAYYVEKQKKVGYNICGVLYVYCLEDEKAGHRACIGAGCGCDQLTLL